MKCGLKKVIYKKIDFQKQSYPQFFAFFVTYVTNTPVICQLHSYLFAQIPAKCKPLIPTLIKLCLLFLVLPHCNCYFGIRSAIIK